MSILSGPKPVSFVRDGVERFRKTYLTRDNRPKPGDVVKCIDGTEWQVKSIASGLGVITIAEIEPIEWEQNVDAQSNEVDNDG